MKLLVSACLLGAACRYDGVSKADDRVLALGKKHTLIPFCPEIYGGLPTPRPASERCGDRVVNECGDDVTNAYKKGAAEALRLAKQLGCDGAVLKARSPSCGRGQIYDGSFTKTLTRGDGVTAALFCQSGIPVYTEEEVEKMP